MSIRNRNKRPYEKPHGRVCKVKSCCDRPSPVNYHTLAHERGLCVADMDMETQWWFECYNCGYICTCEV